jgi:hypothetical protein
MNSLLLKLEHLRCLSVYEARWKEKQIQSATVLSNLIKIYYHDAIKEFATYPLFSTHPYVVKVKQLVETTYATIKKRAEALEEAKKVYQNLISPLR